MSHSFRSQYDLLWFQNNSCLWLLWLAAVAAVAAAAATTFDILLT